MLAGLLETGNTAPLWCICILQARLLHISVQDVLSAIILSLQVNNQENAVHMEIGGKDRLNSGKVSAHTVITTAEILNKLELCSVSAVIKKLFSLVGPVLSKIELASTKPTGLCSSGRPSNP